MPRKPVGFRLEAELVARMEAAVDAGLAANKTELVERALEKALGDSVASNDGGASPSAPSRPSDWGPMDEVLSKPPKAFVESTAFETRPRPWRQPHRPTCRCAVCSPPKS